MIKIVTDRTKFFDQTKFILFKYLLVAILLFLYPSNLFAFHIAKISPPQDKQSTIYVSPNTVVHGLEHFTIAASEEVVYVAPETVVSGQSNLKIGKVLSNTKISIVSQPIDNHEKGLGISKEFDAENKVKDQVIQQLEEKVQNRISKTIYSTGYNTPLSILYHYKTKDGGILNNSTSYSFANVINLFVGFGDRFDVQIVKQNFFVLVTHLLSGITDTAFLRGPPVFDGLG